MILIDSLLVGGLRFVFDKLAQAVDAELHDDTRLRDELLAAQMRLELGEITEEEFAAAEADLLRRIREARSRGAASPAAGPVRLASVEATFAGEEHGAPPAAARSRRRRRG